MYIDTTGALYRDYVFFVEMVVQTFLQMHMFFLNFPLISFHLQLNGHLICEFD